MSNEKIKEHFKYNNILGATELFMSKGGQQFDMWRNTKMSELGELRDLRIKLLTEEMSEYLAAEGHNDLVEIVDGLLDVIVIAWGTLLSYVGPSIAREAAHEVFASNLAKVIGEGLPKYREDGKIMKPEGWEPPDIAAVIFKLDARRRAQAVISGDNTKSDPR